MLVYDKIGKNYRQERSSSIGLREIQQLIKDHSARSVLDLGCGNGFPIGEGIYQKVERYVGVDSSRVLLQEFKQNAPDVELVHSKLETMDLPHHSFDLVFSFGVIFHLNPETQKVALQKAAACVKEKGVLSFTSGLEEGYCTGTVCGHRLDHWSLGEEGYKAELTPLGFEYAGHQVGEGENIFLTFTRTA